MMRRPQPVRRCDSLAAFLCLASPRALASIGMQGWGAMRGRTLRPGRSAPYFDRFFLVDLIFAGALATAAFGGTAGVARDSSRKGGG